MPTVQPSARTGAPLPATARRGAAAAPVALLRDARGHAVPLERVTARGRLTGLLFELTVEQHYRNDGKANLEAVFTFPVPLRAALLGFELEIGERKLAAVAAARREAAERYEQALDAGDTAVLIESAGDGLHTVSVGNLMPGERAVIRYRYAELLDAHEGQVRLNVPTAIAPRYGNPADAGLEGPAVPGTDLLAQYAFEFRVELVGLEDPTVVRSPSHALTVTPSETGLTVALARAAWLDRDVVLEIAQAAIPTWALVAADGDGYVVLGSTTLALDRAEHRPLALKVLLDCSGSMGGDSIAAAKRALLGMLDRLEPGDHISLTRFGSSVEQVSEGLEPADVHTLVPLRARVAQLDADLGGTEMAGALAATLAIPVPAGTSADVVLITDGEIYDITRVVETAAASGQRLFPIAIGVAPVEALARRLAERTGSAYEFVAPGEDAEAAILRTFKRLRAAPRTLAESAWPAEPLWTVPSPAAVFPGDTLHVMARFATRPEAGRDIQLRVRDGAGADTRIVLPVAETLVEGDVIARVAAHRRLGALEEAEATALALQYQLASTYTSLVVVAERSEAEKAGDLPTTVAVPHMLAAGWGGAASVLHRRASSIPAVDMCLSMRPEIPRSARWSVGSFDGASADPPHLDIADAVLERFASDLDQVLISLVAAVGAGEAVPATIAELVGRHGLPGEVAGALAALLSADADERSVVGVFLSLLAQRSRLRGLDWRVLDQLKGGWLGLRRQRALRRKVLKEVLGG